MHHPGGEYNLMFLAYTTHQATFILGVSALIKRTQQAMYLNLLLLLSTLAVSTSCRGRSITIAVAQSPAVIALGDTVTELGSNIIYKDNKDELWLGTHASGSYKFNAKAVERFQP